MDVIKEVHRHEGYPPRCILRTETYAHSFAHFELLVQEAKRDFPTLDNFKIEIVHYGGQRYKGTFGIEFVAPSEVPDTYRAVNSVEFTL